MGFVNGLLAGLARQGIDAAPLLAATGIDIADTATRIPVDRYAALYNQINRRLDDEGFGLFCQPMRLGSFEFLCRSCISSQTLAEALLRAGRFLRIVLPDLSVTVLRQQDRAELVIGECRCLADNPDDPGRVFAFEWLLRLLHALACWLAGRGIALDSVTFPYRKPSHSADYALIFTEDSRFVQTLPGAVGTGPADPRAAGLRRGAAAPSGRSRSGRFSRRRSRQDHHALSARPRDAHPRP